MTKRASRYMLVIGVGAFADCQWLEASHLAQELRSYRKQLSQVSGAIDESILKLPIDLYLLRNPGPG